MLLRLQSRNTQSWFRSGNEPLTMQGWTWNISHLYTMASNQKREPLLPQFYLFHKPFPALSYVQTNSQQISIPYLDSAPWKAPKRKGYWNWRIRDDVLWQDVLLRLNRCGRRDSNRHPLLPEKAKSAVSSLAWRKRFDRTKTFCSLWTISSRLERAWKALLVDKKVLIFS